MELVINTTNLFEVEKQIIIRVMTITYGDLKAASARLGISRHALYRRLVKHQINRAAFKPPTGRK